MDHCVLLFLWYGHHYVAQGATVLQLFICLNFIYLVTGNSPKSTNINLAPTAIKS
jgi:hypothetical protein